LNKKSAEQQELVNFHKNKNKELESRIDELLKMNSELKIRLTNLNSASTNQFSVQFYKDQVSKLETEVAELKDKIKRMINDHEGVKSTV
jgi:polyhydroxyalkanoate synthesis regulator phasin